MHVLRAENLAKRYAGHLVVRDVTISINSGQVVGLLGPNGAGKTTCFYMIVGSIKGDAGKIYFDDQDISLKAIHERANIGLGYLPQEASVFRKLSVAENIMAILETRHHLSMDERQEKLESLLEEFHISHIRSNL